MSVKWTASIIVEFISVCHEIQKLFKAKMNTFIRTNCVKKGIMCIILS